MEKKNLSAIIVVGLFVMSFALISTFAVVPVSAVADTCGGICSVSVTPTIGAPGTGFAISSTGIFPPQTRAPLSFVGVVTPNGEVYVLYPPFVAYFPNGGPVTCTIPFGTLGSLSFSSPTGASIPGCTGSNSGVWEQQTTGSAFLSLSAMESDCSPPGSSALVSSSSGVGSTSESGSYDVIACWGGLFATNTFSVTSSQTNGVPEFPIASLSFVLLVALLLPALLVMSRKFRARPGL